jgi:hypothetical protein
VHDKRSPLKTPETAAQGPEANLVNCAASNGLKDAIGYRQAIFFTSSQFLHLRSDRETVFFDL